MAYNINQTYNGCLASQVWITRYCEDHECSWEEGVKAWFKYN